MGSADRIARKHQSANAGGMSQPQMKDQSSQPQIELPIDQCARYDDVASALAGAFVAVAAFLAAVAFLDVVPALLIAAAAAALAAYVFWRF